MSRRCRVFLDEFNRREISADSSEAFRRQPDWGLIPRFEGFSLASYGNIPLLGTSGLSAAYPARARAPPLRTNCRTSTRSFARVMARRSAENAHSVGRSGWCSRAGSNSRPPHCELGGRAQQQIM
jgi:hypothetical protein